jgi:hypothetical protein
MGFVDGGISTSRTAHNAPLGEECRGDVPARAIAEAGSWLFGHILTNSFLLHFRDMQAVLSDDSVVGLEFLILC